MSQMKKLITDVSIYFKAVGDLKAAASLLHDVTGAHSFRPGEPVPGYDSMLMSFVGTAYAALDDLGPVLMAVGPETYIPELDNAGLEFSLRFAHDPIKESQVDMIAALAVALGAKTHCVLLDADAPELHPIFFDNRNEAR